MSVDFSAHLYYDESSPSCLRWKNDIYYGRYRTLIKVHKDDVAGSLDKDGYWQVKLLGKCYKVHKIVMILQGNTIDTFHIDHINGIKTDNRVCNLRVVTPAINARNRPMQSNNRTGVTGVSLIDNKRYRAQYVDLDGEVKTKYFPIKIYGEEAFTEAVKFREEMLQMLKEKGVGYTDRHGLQEKLK